MRHYIITVLFVVYTISVVAQNDSIKTFKIQGYGELYYSYDFQILKMVKNQILFITINDMMKSI